MTHIVDFSFECAPWHSNLEWTLIFISRKLFLDSARHLVANLLLGWTFNAVFNFQYLFINSLEPLRLFAISRYPVIHILNSAWANTRLTQAKIMLHFGWEKPVPKRKIAKQLKDARAYIIRPKYVCVLLKYVVVEPIHQNFVRSF